MLRFLLFLVFLNLIPANKVFADWLTGNFTPRAGIDSLERFMILRDAETGHLFGSQILNLGDITGDGASDILVCRNEGNFLLEMLSFLYHGGQVADTVYEEFFSNFNPTIEPIGDINNDGFADFGKRHIFIDTLLKRTFQIFLGGLDFDDSPDFVINGVSSRIPRAYDLDVDGHLDLPLSEDINGGFVRIYTIDSLRDTIPEYIIPDTAEGFGRNIATGDFNGDGHADLVVAAYLNRDTNLIKFYWGGPDFDTIPDFVIKNPAVDIGEGFGDFLVPLGDFNGDGYQDIFIAGNTNEPYGIYYGGPSIDDQLDLIVNPIWGSYFPPTSVDVAGDINNDGFPDVVFSYNNDPAFYYAVHILLGGPTTDTLRAYDIYIEHLMIPGPQIFWGFEVAGIGDFNGDGIDDIAVASRTTSGSNYTAEVHLIAGWDSKATDVPYEYEPVLPDNFLLKQNYPNPFNPATTIEFDLPRRGYASLSVYNILGEKIETLLNQELAAGLYSLQWDGRTDTGARAASGVYFYRLEIEGRAESRKMVLLK